MILRSALTLLLAGAAATASGGPGMRCFSGSGRSALMQAVVRGRSVRQRPKVALMTSISASATSASSVRLSTIVTRQAATGSMPSFTSSAA